MENLKHCKPQRNLSTRMPQFFFSTILCFVALVYNSFFFFRTAFVRKLFDIRFSYKHCNFSRGCLLVKMASKTVTRSTIFCFTAQSLVANEGLDGVNPKLSNCLKLNLQPSKMQININRHKVSRYFFFKISLFQLIFTDSVWLWLLGNLLIARPQNLLYLEIFGNVTTERPRQPPKHNS